MLPRSRATENNDSFFSISFEPFGQSARYSKNHYTEFVDIKSKIEMIAIINDT